MAESAAYTNDDRNRAYLYLNVYEQSTSPANNQSTVYWNASVSDGNGSFGGYSYSDGSWSVTVNGVSRASASGQSYDFGSGVIGSPYFPRSESGTFVVNHNTNGTAGPIAGSASFNGNSPAGSASVSVSAALTTFTAPGAPSAAPTLTRTSPFTTIGITSAVASSNGSLAPTRYDYDYNTDNTTWGNNITSMGAGATRVSSKNLLSSTTGYYFRTRAVSNQSNTWGNGAWSASAFKAGVPSAPASISTSRSGLSVTVTVTASATNGGATITGYTVERSTDGTTWTNPQSMTSLSYTYTNLTPGFNYLFRAYATNSTGNSATVTSSSVFVSAYGRRYVTASISEATSGSTTTFTSNGHGFSQNDPVTITGVTPTSFNISGTITVVSTNTFTVGTASTGTYSSGGTVSGWRSNLTGKRYDGTNWVDISVASRYTGTSWASFS